MFKFRLSVCAGATVVSLSTECDPVAKQTLDTNRVECCTENMTLMATGCPAPAIFVSSRSASRSLIHILTLFLMSQTSTILQPSISSRLNCCSRAWGALTVAATTPRLFHPLPPTWIQKNGAIGLLRRRRHRLVKAEPSTVPTVRTRFKGPHVHLAPVPYQQSIVPSSPL